MRRAAALLAVLSLLTLASCSNGPKPVETTRTVGVQLFQWNWNSIARECTDVLGPGNFGFVLTSPPQEHTDGPEWWTSYQPVSYLIESKLGTRQEFAAMVTACHDAGVKVIADAVINHMAGIEGGTGVAGSTFTHYDYPGIYQTQDFHHCGLTQGDDIVNYQDQQQVQECELSNLADLDTGSEYVRGQIVEYLDDLLSLGVDGFRIDAAKHMLASDVAAIVGALDGDPIIISEVIGNPTEPVQPADYTDFGGVFAFAFAEDVGGFVSGGSIKFVMDLTEPGVDSAHAYTFVTNHDTERNGKTLSYKDGPKFDLATILMLAVPYGTPVTYSGYAFSARDEGATTDADGRVEDVVCPSVPGPELTYDAGEWVCEHRWPSTLGMVMWRSVVGEAPVENFWTEGYAIAFDRGELGFIAISDNSSRVLENLTFTTNLPDGAYCNELTAPAPGSVEDRCPTGEYEVKDGEVTLTLQPMSAVALDVNLREK